MLGSSVHLDRNGQPYRLFEVTRDREHRRTIVPGPVHPGVRLRRQGARARSSRSRQGERVKLRVRNHLPELHPQFGHPFNTSTHLHGSASLPQFDGYANDVTHPGDYKDYWYPNWQPARTLWYHDHNVMTTAQNAYSGLAAQYHLTDPAEQALLPQGHFDVPVTISDAMFAANGSLAYNDNSHSGLWGDVVLVNGKPWPTMKVKPAIYRFRVLNASIARSFRLRLSNGAPLHMVATDGGLMPRTQPVVEYKHAGAERYEFLVDFRRYVPGTQINLTNLSNANNVDYDHTNKVMRFEVVADSPDNAGRQAAHRHPGPAGQQRGHEPDHRPGDEPDHHPPRAVRRHQRVPDQRQDLARRREQRVHERARPTPGRTRSACGRSRTAAAGGSTRCTSTSSTSRSSPATAGPAPPGSRAPRMSSTSARTRRSSCS